VAPRRPLEAPICDDAYNGNSCCRSLTALGCTNDDSCSHTTATNVNYTFQLRENYRYSNCGRDFTVCGGNAPCDLERETKPPTAADSQPVCSTPASSSSSSRVFLKWPKQQRHHEDHYIIITCREVYIRVLTVGHGDSFARTVRELVAFSASP